MAGHRDATMAKIWSEGIDVNGEDDVDNLLNDLASSLAMSINRERSLMREERDMEGLRIDYSVY